MKLRRLIDRALYGPLRRPAPLAWLRQQPPGTVVAVLDTGELRACGSVGEAEEAMDEEKQEQAR